MTASRLRRMPGDVRAIREPWRSLVGTIPGLTAEAERAFRFGQRVAATEHGYLLGGPIKGGSSSMWYPVDRAAYEAYLAWRAIEGVGPDPDPAGFVRLLAHLELFGVELATGNGAAVRGGKPRARFDPAIGGAYALAHAILRELPPWHLERDELVRLQLGGTGPDAAKASAYVDGAVIIYDFAIRGARRTFGGLLLHELGHANERALEPAARDELRAAFGAIAAADAFFGMEFLLDAAARRGYQRLAFAEFAAELYLAYAACGSALRAFIVEQAPAARDAWVSAYGVLWRAFDGLEYE